ncbi:MAG: polysaccharide deacetylase family protein [Bdellovibrionales bacterium]|nr:polysaccharide deacetylase family protein [Bdellovibrionales bacterium]
MTDLRYPVLRRSLPRSFKDLVKKVLESYPLSPLRKWYRGVGSVLMYHRITDYKNFHTSWGDSSVFQPHLGLSVNAERFREQMRYISQHCIPVPISDLDAVLAGEKSSKKPLVAVTFDDGYKDNLTLALPIAEEFQVPISIFVTTGFVSRTVGPWWLLLEDVVRNSKSVTFGGEVFDCKSVTEKQQTFLSLDRAFRHATGEEQQRYLREIGAEPTESYLESLYLDWSEVKRLAEHSLVTIGAHTVTHPLLSQESRRIVRDEMLHSREVLEENLLHPIKYFAYPFGDRLACGNREIEVASELNFAIAFTTRSGHIFPDHVRHAMALPRITVDYFDDLPRFRRKLSGVESITSDPFHRIVTT